MNFGLAPTPAAVPPPRSSPSAQPSPASPSRTRASRSTELRNSSPCRTSWTRPPAPEIGVGTTTIYPLLPDLGGTIFDPPAPGAMIQGNWPKIGRDSAPPRSSLPQSSHRSSAHRTRSSLTPSCPRGRLTRMLRASRDGSRSAESVSFQTALPADRGACLC
jgi:hypothetical protein